MKEATRGIKYTTEPSLYLAFELSKEKWKLGFSTGLGQHPRTRTPKSGCSAAMASAASMSLSSIASLLCCRRPWLGTLTQPKPAKQKGPRAGLLQNGGLLLVAYPPATHGGGHVHFCESVLSSVIRSCTREADSGRCKKLLTFDRIHGIIAA